MTTRTQRIARFAPVFLLLISISHRVSALLNGAALTPPMGWMAWQRYRCATDCSAADLDCVSEGLIMAVSDAFESDGWKDAGYEYVSLDDVSVTAPPHLLCTKQCRCLHYMATKCWQAPQRNETGHVVPDPVRFPRGLKFLADYGNNICSNLPLFAHSHSSFKSSARASNSACTPPWVTRHALWG